MSSEIPKPSKPSRKFGKYIFLFLFILFLLWVYIPRPLSSEVKQQLATMQKLHATPSKAFVYSIGMEAPDDIDPMVYGQKLLPQYVAISNIDLHDKNPQFSIKKPQGNTKNYSAIFDDTSLKCSISNDQNGIDNLFNDKVARKTLIKKHFLLINRYQTYKSFGDYHQLYKMNLYTFPEYTVLINGQKLYFLQQVDLVDTHKISPQMMRDNILDDLAHWRSELITADNLIGKMIVSVLARNDLIMLSEIHLRYGISAPRISELTASERSFELVNAAETEFVANIDSDIQQAQDKCGTDDSKLTCFGKSIWYFLSYDHNDTVNMIAHSRALEFKQATLPLPELYTTKDQVPASYSFDHWIKNSMGAYTSQSTLGIYLHYVFRVNNLNLQIALLDATANQPVGNSDPKWLQAIANPYGTAAGHAYIDKQGWLCFPLPIKDNNRPTDGCIPWKNT